MAEGWLGRLANSEEAAKSEDIRTYVEMIITTPKEMLEAERSVTREYLRESL